MQNYCIIFGAALQAKHSFAGCYFCTHFYKEDDIYEVTKWFRICL
nr:MAG TPA: hypothetical protein [Caudoviricetes sp.]DAZ26967.1 MAG TPA: hypothetical protein [Caudoviricetes sp.]